MPETELNPINKFQKYLKKLKYSYRALPDKKQYIEFFTALLSVPVLVTVIILNVSNLSGNKNDDKTPSPTSSPIVVTVPVRETSPVPQNTSGACKRGIGPITIDSPEAGEVVTDNPVQIFINYEQGEYCAVVWSYSINGGRFSDYSSNSIALYNPPSGQIKFQLKVKSVVTSEEKLLTRNFTYAGAPTPTTPTSSTSAN